MNKIGRNEPCRCGSGKKYKKCCMMKDKAKQHREASLHAHQGAVGKAIQWLERRYGDEIQDWIQQEWFGEIDMDEIDAISTDLAEMMNINGMEMMLAEGSWVDDYDVDYKFIDRVLGQGGPLMSAEQRQYLQTLQKTPLRLWEVTDVLPGVGLTLIDCFDNTCVRKVKERTASAQLQQWDVIGARPLQVPAGHWEVSGALYHFPRNQAEALKQYLTECLDGVPEDQQASTFSDILAYDWLTMMLNPQPFMPQIMDGASGEALMFITEHYHVNDWTALEAALNSAANVDGDRKRGWNRSEKLDKDTFRSLATVNIGSKKDRIELFTKSIKRADEQQAWFENLTENSVRHLTRELGDPMSLLRHSDRENTEPKSDIPDDVRQQLEHDYKRKHYAGWPDTALPALNGKTPRQAVETAKGRGQVIRLLKDFENSEARAVQPFSFDFLWQALGLDR